jgi:hypothetical protein
MFLLPRRHKGLLHEMPLLVSHAGLNGLLKNSAESRLSQGSNSQLAEKLNWSDFVSGLDFSRADSANKMTGL